MTLKTNLIKFNWLLNTQVGISPFTFVNSVKGIPRYLSNLYTFARATKGYKIELMPCLHDWNEEAGITKGEYFWQDLLVARWIHEARPQRHVDVGSRVDGFVAHVASFREIEVFDVRPITTQIPGVVFRQADLMDSDSVATYTSEGGYCDSLSCLHAIEHFGLGRYGDPINPQGYQLGIKNMASLLTPEGTFYLSTPIGRERVEFNANWVFGPKTIISFAESNRLKLKQMTVIGRGGIVQNLEANEDILMELDAQPYNLGIFTFTKLS